MFLQVTSLELYTREGKLPIVPQEINPLQNLIKFFVILLNIGIRRPSFQRLIITRWLSLFAETIRSPLDIPSFILLVRDGLPISRWCLHDNEVALDDEQSQIMFDKFDKDATGLIKWDKIIVDFSIKRRYPLTIIIVVYLSMFLFINYILLPT